MKNIDTKTFVTEWVKDLRSGKFKQTQGKLCEKESDGTPSYCCLGVACVTGKRLGLTTKAFSPDTNPKSGGIPTHGWFVELFGENADPIIEKIYNEEEGAYRTITCITANDEEKWDFNRIAAALENTFLK